jgi:hypothetical protein
MAKRRRYAKAIKTRPARPTGHPPFVPTPSERSFVQTMAGARMSADEICKVIGSARGDGRPIAKTTLYRRFGNEMKTSRQCSRH